MGNVSNMKYSKKINRVFKKESQLCISRQAKAMAMAIAMLFLI